MTPSLENLLHSTAKKMLADFEVSGQAKHRGSKGTVREDKVREFLDAHLPRTVDVVGSSEVVAADGDRSTQCDVMITDPNAPFLFDEDSYRIATIEGVFGVIEVKSSLTTDQLREAMRKIAKIKAMPRTAYMPTVGPQRWRRMYGREWHNMPMVGMVFAYDGAELDTLGEVVAEVADELTDHPEQRTDSVWVLNRGALVWVDSKTEQINAAPNPGDSIGAISASPGEVLVHMTAHLHELFAAAWTTGVRFSDYLSNARFGRQQTIWKPVDGPEG